MIYMIIAGYFEDDASDELTNDPVFKPIPYDWQNTSKKSLQCSDATGCHSGFGFHSS